MTLCQLPGLWNQIKGSPPYLSEQEFMAENINLLCQLANAGGTGTGGCTVAAGPPPTDGSVTTLIYKDSATGFKYVNLGTSAAPDWDVI